MSGAVFAPYMVRKRRHTLGCVWLSMMCMNLSARSARLANGDGILERSTVSMQQSSRLNSLVSHPSEANSSSVFISLVFLDGLGDDPTVMLATSTRYGLGPVFKSGKLSKALAAFGIGVST